MFTAGYVEPSANYFSILDKPDYNDESYVHSVHTVSVPGMATNLDTNGDLSEGQCQSEGQSQEDSEDSNGVSSTQDESAYLVRSIRTTTQEVSTTRAVNTNVSNGNDLHKATVTYQGVYNHINQECDPLSRTEDDTKTTTIPLDNTEQKFWSQNLVILFLSF